MDRFVRPEVVRIPLAGGDWITVKKRLSSGERREAYSKMFQIHNDKYIPVPWLLGITKVAAYLVDWNFTADGQPVPIAREPLDVVIAAVNRLDDDSFAEIHTAIDQHETAMLAERAEEKKIQAGVMPSPLTSPLPADAVGAMSG